MNVPNSRVEPTERRSALDDAERYAALGWPVFPVHSISDGRCTCGNSDCDSPGKHPRTEHGFKDATIDINHIRRWSDRWRGSNIGVATGTVSDLLVIDIDDERAFEALVDAYGLLPDTVEQHTGRGRQLFFRYPADVTVRNKTALGGNPGVDVRGDGGYVVVPPSLHKNGKAYVWEASSDPTEGVDPAALPEPWLTLLAEPAAADAGAPSGTDESVLGQGHRNDGLFRLAAFMRSKGMSPGAIESALREENQARCQPPLDEKEVRSIANSAGRYEAGTIATSRTNAAVVQAWRPFPVQVLPEPLGSFVREGARALGCDPTYLALPALAVVASVIGNTRRIRLKRRWTEPPVVWVAIIGHSGTLKTPAYMLVTAPILELQRVALKEYQAALDEYEKEVERYEKARNEFRRSKSAYGDPPKKPERPVAQRFIVSDVTVEALASILEGNSRGVLLARDELAAWFGSFDRYSGGSGKVKGDAAQWESMHNAGHIIVDRKTGDKKTLFIAHAAVSICGGIQPGTLRRALGVEHFEGGLAQRFLFAMPPRKPKRWTHAEIPESVEAAFVEMIQKLAELRMNPAKDEDGDPTPVDVPLTADALQAWADFVNEHGQDQMRTSGYLAAAYSKLEAYAARFALIFHFIRWANADSTLEDPNAVDVASVRAGIELARWFCHETGRVYAILRESDEDRASRELIEWIDRRGGVVTPRELQAGKREFRGSSDDARSALQALVDQGFGTWESPTPGPEGGRAGMRFRLVSDVSVNETPAGDHVTGGFVDADSVDTRENAPCGDAQSGPPSTASDDGDEEVEL